MELVAGTKVTPNVVLVRELSRGGMGSVWVADHLTLATQVAVKFVVLDPEDTDAIERFRREALISAKIDSPHVVRVFDCGVTVDEDPYIVMELLKGESFADRLLREKTVDLETISLVISQAAEALTAAHGAGVVHRDIKPDNLFLTQSGYKEFVKILDFGIAKHSKVDSKITATGAILGTPGYMSPEQVLGESDVDHRADVWAMGVTLYESVTGQLPFEGASLGAQLMAICKGEYEAPTELVPALPSELDAWCQRAMCVDRAQRFPSVQVMADELAMIAGIPDSGLVRSGQSERGQGAPTLQSPAHEVPSGDETPKAATFKGVAVADLESSDASSSVRRRVLGGVAAVMMAGVAVWAFTRASNSDPSATRGAEVETTAVAVGTAQTTASQPTAAPPQPSATSVLSKTVSLQIEATPPSAKVYWGDKMLGVTSAPLRLPRADELMTLQLRSPGYQSEDIAVVPDRDLTVKVTLERVVPRPSPPSVVRPSAPPPPESYSTDLVRSPTFEQ